ncbi:WhiB family transcriptional regulator [Streptomyces sp. C10-9-1]|uniref:WhiB family transcriptional regulator n=1 Tax=Streptomyces sp. C10-9-1 TaxID=1859285 RepID=UPI003F4A0A2A
MHRFIVPTHSYAPVVTAESARPRAACENQDPDLFFPDGSTGPALLQIEQAKKICRTCPLMFECLRDALERGEEHGVWGGLSEDDRNSLRRSAAVTAARAA